MLKFVSLIIFAVLSNYGMTQEIDCAKFKEGRFIYPTIPNSVSAREGNKQKSYTGGKLEAVWKVVWIDECTYTLTCKKIIKDKFNIKKGDRIYVEIIGTEGDCMDVNISLLGGNQKKSVQTGRMCLESNSKMEQL